ncbi:MAG TPA: hypothetical protein VGQ83_40600 [Polyangia bacterium]
MQYVPPSGTFHIDILHRLGEAFGFEDIQVEDHVVEGIHVPVATARMLYRMKKDPPDVYRHRRIEDANRVTDSWQGAAIRACRRD